MSKGGKKNKKAASGGDGDDDWEALLAAEAASNGATKWHIDCRGASMLVRRRSHRWPGGRKGGALRGIA